MGTLVHIRDQGTADLVDFASEPAPKKTKTVLSVDKVMATALKDTQVVIYINNLEKGETIKGLFSSAKV